MDGRAILRLEYGRNDTTLTLIPKNDVRPNDQIEIRQEEKRKECTGGRTVGHTTVL